MEKYMEALNRVVKPCSCCGNKGYLVKDTPYFLLKIDESGTVNPGKGGAVISIVCPQCGHLEFFDKNKLDQQLSK